MVSQTTAATAVFQIRKALCITTLCQCISNGRATHQNPTTGKANASGMSTGGQANIYKKLVGSRDTSAFVQDSSQVSQARWHLQGRRGAERPEGLEAEHRGRPGRGRPAGGLNAVHLARGQKHCCGPLCAHCNGPKPPPQ